MRSEELARAAEFGAASCWHHAVSELVRPLPDGPVLAWVDQGQVDRLWLTSMIAAHRTKVFARASDESAAPLGAVFLQP